MNINENGKYVQRFEHKVTMLTREAIADTIVEYQSEGWEIITAFVYPGSVSQSREIWWKRPVAINIDNILKDTLSKAEADEFARDMTKGIANYEWRLFK